MSGSVNQAGQVLGATTAVTGGVALLANTGSREVAIVTTIVVVAIVIAVLSTVMTKRAIVRK